MKKIEIEKLEKIIGGLEMPRQLRCAMWATLFPPIIVGCMMRDLDDLFA